MKLTIALASAAILAGALLLPTKKGFILTSPTFNSDNDFPQVHVLNEFGCNGGNRSPALQWSNPPVGTKSYAITLYDPDAPTGSGWWHWVVYNIPANARDFPENAGGNDGLGLPNGAVQGRTDFGRPGYGGPCPPPGSGLHHYVMTIHALKVEKLALPPDASAAMVGFMINANKIDSAVLRAIYSR